MFKRDELRSLDSNIALEILRQIEAQGIDAVRVAIIADRVGVGVGTLYSRWGGRQALLEHAWRQCMASIEYEVNRALVIVGPATHAIDSMCERIQFALPPQLDAFVELHTARRRWYRSDTDPDGMVVPSLAAFVELGQRFGHFRPGPVRVLAALIWWVTMGAFTNRGHQDKNRLKWCVEALKRVLLKSDRMVAEEALAALEITEVPPRSSAPPPAPPPAPP